MNYPYDRKVRLLRLVKDDMYAQYEETWSILGESLTDKFRKKLVSVTPTGRTFQRLGRVVPGLTFMKPDNVITLYDSETFDQIVFKLVEGEADDKDEDMIGFSNKTFATVLIENEDTDPNSR